MKPLLTGRHIFLRDSQVQGAGVASYLRCNPTLNQYLSLSPPSIEYNLDFNYTERLHQGVRSCYLKVFTK